MIDTGQQQEAREKSWQILNRQAETLLRLSEAQTAPWKLVIGGVGTGAVLFAAGLCIRKLFQ
jgi:hypothetical protein